MLWWKEHCALNFFAVQTQVSFYIYTHKGIIWTSCSRCKQENYGLYDKNIYYYELLKEQIMYDFQQIFHRTIWIPLTGLQDSWEFLELGLLEAPANKNTWNNEAIVKNIHRQIKWQSINFFNKKYTWEGGERVSGGSERGAERQIQAKHAGTELVGLEWV